MDTKILEQEFDYYIENQRDLVDKYNGKYLVIKDKKIQGAYEMIFDALNFGKEKFGMGNFIIQKCGPGKENYTTTFHTPIIFSRNG